MGKHWENFKYIVRHKWFVARMGLKYRVWWHQLLIHDWSKFTPSEWYGYANNFFSGKKTDGTRSRFMYSWNAHQKRNKHHWNYWVCLGDGSKNTVLKMPERFVREMVADWAGASMAIRGFDDTLNWYTANREKMQLHPETRELVEQLIGWTEPSVPSILSMIETRDAA